MTTEQRNALVEAIHNKHQEFNSSFSEVRDAVAAVVEMLTEALDEMDCND